MPGASRLAVALSFAAIACGEAIDLTNPRVIALELRGTWSETFDIPGAATVLQLGVADTTVSGSGTFAIEAGSSGTLTVTGVISGSLVKINFTRSDGMIGHFNGTLKSVDKLTGSLWYSSDPIMVEFRRTSR